MADLRLLQLNIEYGGTGVDFEKVVDVVLESGAVVAAIQEGCGAMPRLAAGLGWPYVDNRTQVVSQHPLLDPPDPSGGSVLVEVEPGRVVAIVNVHPPSRRYGPFRVAKGEGDERLLASERRIRLSALQPSLDAAARFMRDGVPVVLLGDFNAPSHLDWTEAAVLSRPHVLRPVRWPTSAAAEECGLVDAFRAVHPDPVAVPGLTWPAERPYVEGYNPAADGHAPDRIDLMLVSPDVRVGDVQVVGEEGSPHSQIVFAPWPTDHRGLLADLSVSAAPAPTLVSASRRIVAVGDVVDVRVNCPDLGSVVAVPRGADPGAVGSALTPAGAGLWQLRTEPVGAGRYDVVACDTGGRERARTSLWVAGPDDGPTLRTDRSFYGVDEVVTVRWSWAPGNRADWLAMYPLGTSPSGSRPLMQVATGATVEGQAIFSARSHPRRWPLPPGRFTVHLLMDDLPVSLASHDFVVHET